MAKVSKSLDQAIHRDRAKNPDRTGYTGLRRGAFNFAHAKKGTKSYQYITSDYAKEHGRYIDDLKDLTRYTVAALKANGLNDKEIKRLL